MVLIQVKPEDKVKTFEILSNNGRFVGLSNNRFNIIENSEKVLQELEDVGIVVKRLN